MNPLTGGFIISKNDNKLWVNHNSLGRHPESVKKQPLILMLEKKPTEIYVECSIDE